MFEERDVRLDLAALAVLVFVVFLGLSLVTFHPADPPVELVYPFGEWYQQDTLTYPVAQLTSNACGRWGSLVSSFLFDSFGLGAYYVVASVGTFAVVLLVRREIDSPALRTTGWIASLVGITTLMTMLIPGWSGNTSMGSGGALGALGTGILRYYFADVGGCILAISLLLGGLLLSTDYVLVHVGLMIGALTMTSMMRRHPLWKGRSSLARSDVEDEFANEEDEADELSVRVGGRTIRLMDDLDADEEEIDDEDEYEDEADEDDLMLEEAAEDDETAEDAEEDVANPAAVSASAATTKLLRGRNGRRRLSPFRVHTPEPEDRETVMSQLDAASLRDDAADYQLPDIELLGKSEAFCFDAQAKEVRRKAKILEKTFADFGFDVKVVEIETGPVIAQYEVALEAGLRLSKITGLADDLAIALRVPSVRIVAPIPGKNTVGIEVPNEERQLVRLREVIAESTAKIKKMDIPIFLGKDVSGNPLTVDLAKLPHLLIAGRTGTGKSVCLNAIIASMLMTRRPDEVRMLMIDPKMVELSGYKSLPHLMHPVVTDMRKAEAILAWAVDKMEERYALLARAGVRHVTSYNQLSEEELVERLDPQSDEERQAIPLHMPFIVIVADEMADLMMTAGKEVEQHIIRLAQKSRAVGIHLILATQKPTVDVITGLIKSNLPARIAFQVASRTDSRVVLDEMGADKLLGNGDMLFLYPGTSMLMRGQGTYLSDEEINAVVAASSQGEQNFVKELVQLKVEDEVSSHSPASLKKRDDLYEQAIEIVVREGRGSCSLLQRALGIGYGRAARLIDFMAEDGIVGEYAGSQAREVLITMNDFQAMQDGGGEERAVSKPMADIVSNGKPKKSKPPLMDDEEEELTIDDDGDYDEEEEDADESDATEESDDEEYDEDEDEADADEESAGDDEGYEDDEEYEYEYEDAEEEEEEEELEESA